MRSKPVFPRWRWWLAAQAALASLAVHAQPYRFTTIAGSYPSVPGSADGTGPAARFRAPTFCAVDLAGNVYVSDSFNFTVRKISAAGVVTTIAGIPGRANDPVNGAAGVSRFRGTPEGIVVDATGTVFVSDSGDHTIRKISPSNETSTFAGQSDFWGTLQDGGPTTARFVSPGALAMDPAGNLYVADGDTALRKVTPDGRVTTLAGGIFGGPFATRQVDGAGNNAVFRAMRGIAVDRAGNIYLSDNGTTIRKVTPTGLVSTFVGDQDSPGTADGVGRAARLSDAKGIAIDSGGSLLVVEGAGTVRRISPQGAVTTVFRRSPTDIVANENFFAHPNHIGISAGGDLYVSDTRTNCLYRIAAGSEAISVFAGTSGNRGFNDGPGPVARFRSPLGIVGDSRGNLFVCDSSNGLIRRLAPGGEVVTIAGSQYPSSITDGVGRAATFTWPWGICVDPSDNLFVTDASFASVRKLTPGAVVTTFVGPTRSSFQGIVDGLGDSARFDLPLGITRDIAGNFYVCERNKFVIRKITADGVVSTIAGLAGVPALVDGAGTEARFVGPAGIAADRSGNLYVADAYAIRKISFSGGRAVVSTLAGSAVQRPGLDGVGTNAGFRGVVGLALDTDNTLFVADGSYIRKITPDGRVTTVGGSEQPNTFDGIGSEAFFFSPHGIWVSPDGTLYFSDFGGCRIVKGEIYSAPTIIAHPTSAAVPHGDSTTLSVTARGLPMRYQWLHNGNAIAGATQATFSIGTTTRDAAGAYTVQITNELGTTLSSPATLRVTEPGRMTNFSVLTQLASAEESLSIGTVVGGAGTSGPKPLLVRAVGPSLATVGVTGAVASVRLEIFNNGVKAGENSAWDGDRRVSEAMAQVGAFTLSDPNSKDAALYLPDAAGANRSIRVSATTPGFVLAELYDATPARTATPRTPRLSNLSVLKDVSGGFIAGFSITGNTAATVLIRAIGPTLAGFGVTGALADPKLEIFDSSPAVIATSTRWNGSQRMVEAFKSAGAFALEPDSQDAVVLISLLPGNYTVQISSSSGRGGMALAEIYEIREISPP